MAREKPHPTPRKTTRRASGRTSGQTSSQTSRKSREAWIEAAVALLGERGVEAIRVEPLARRLGVTKGSFYWHFTDRAELLTAVLEQWSKAGTDAFIEQVEAEGGDPRTRLRRLWALTSKGALQAEMAIRDWARRDPEVDAQVHDVDTRRLAYLRSLFGALDQPRDKPRDKPRAEVEARCLLMYSLLFGNTFIQGSHGRLGRNRVLEEALALLVDT
ncbi:MAG: TetR/AcrR family transcriptional regulator [Myxococcota bacterium]